MNDRLFKNLGVKNPLQRALKENDYESNSVSATAITLFVLVCILWLGLDHTGLIVVDRLQMRFIYLNLIIGVITLLIYAFIKKKGYGITKYLLIFAMVAMSYVTAARISYYLLIIFIIPVLMSSMYYNKKLTLNLSIICLMLMLLALVEYNDKFGILFGLAWNTTRLQIVWNIMYLYYLPYVEVYAIATLISWYSVNHGIKTLKNNAMKDAKMKVYKRDLDIASEIQYGLLPTKMPKSDAFDVSASMAAAKQVGGDFFNCFMVDKDKVAVMIADVSGKGVPASLFMSCSKTLVDSNIKTGMDLEKAITKSNNELYENNRMKYFVTLWVGIIDIRTGRMEYVNAGHNPPFIISSEGITRIDTKPDFIFGRKKNIVYHRHSIQLKTGDRLYLYTDGVTEAMNRNNEQFGEERLKNTLSETSGNPAEVIRNVNDALKNHVGNAPQSDDITMLVFDYLGKKNTVLTVDSNRDGYGQIMECLNRELNAACCDPTVMNKFEISCSELFSNIDMYAYKGKEETGKVRFEMDISEKSVSVTLTDWGIPFDPLKHEDPDATENFRKHIKGGLGIMLVKKLMDDVRYERKDNCNILTITKEI